MGMSTNKASSNFKAECINDTYKTNLRPQQKPSTTFHRLFSFWSCLNENNDSIEESGFSKGSDQRVPLCVATRPLSFFPIWRSSVYHLSGRDQQRVDGMKLLVAWENFLTVYDGDGSLYDVLEAANQLYTLTYKLCERQSKYGDFSNEDIAQLIFGIWREQLESKPESEQQRWIRVLYQLDIRSIETACNQTICNFSRQLHQDDSDHSGAVLCVAKIVRLMREKCLTNGIDLDLDVNKKSVSELKIIKNILDYRGLNEMIADLEHHESCKDVAKRLKELLYRIDAAIVNHQSHLKPIAVCSRNLVFRHSTRLSLVASRS